MAIHIRRREFIVALGGVATARAALTVSGPALGQDYPNRQITILVGIAAGGITDSGTRKHLWLLDPWLEHFLKKILLHYQYDEFADELTNAHVPDLCLER